MRDKLLYWLLSKLFNFIGLEDRSVQRKKLLKEIIIELYKDNISDYALDKEIKEIIFNAKYTDNLRKLPGHAFSEPSKELLLLYTLANKGEAQYMKHPFYRLLSKNKDIEVKRLHYRLKRNQ